MMKKKQISRIGREDEPMTNQLVDRVVPKDRVLFCQRCREMVGAKFSESGQHIRADCPECGRYIKFARQVAEHPRYAEPDLYDDDREVDELPW